MKLSQCRAFVSVADTGTFTAAARLLGISQSAVSHAVTALEKEIGAELLNREYGKATPTAAGQHVLQSARGMLKHAEEIASVSFRLASVPEAPLRVGVGLSFSKRELPRLLGDLRTRHPHMPLDVRVAPCAQVTKWLRRGTVDVGITTVADGLAEASPLVRDRVHVVLAAEHPLCAAPVVHVRQLAHEPLLVPGGMHERDLYALLQGYGVTPRITFRLDDPSTLLTLIANGHGLTLLPRIVFPERSSRMRALPLVPAVPCDQFVAVSEAGQDNPYAEELVALLRSSVRHCAEPVPAVRTPVLPHTALLPTPRRPGWVA